jgi:hypothetical protein
MKDRPSTASPPAPPAAYGPAIDTRPIRARLEQARRQPSLPALRECACDAEALLGEVDRLAAECARRSHDHAAVCAALEEASAELARVQATLRRVRHVHGLLDARHARLLTAARAAAAAAAAGQPVAAAWVVEHLAESGQLPPAGADPRRVAALVEGR